MDIKLVGKKLEDRLGDLDFFHMSKPAGFSGFGFTKHYASSVSESIDIVEAVLIFFNDDTSDIRIIESTRELGKIIEDNKFFGNLIVIDEDWTLYYETIEGIGFILLTEKAELALREKLASSIDRIQKVFWDEIKIIGQLNPRAEAYERKMKELLKAN